MNKLENKLKKRSSSSEKVYSILREMIDNLELFPGTRITETGIANLLSVSRTPIREALQRLQYEGQIEVIPRQGCFIRNIDIDQINKFYDVRIILESRTIELACDFISRPLLESMLKEWCPDKLSDDYSLHLKTIRKKEESFHVNIAKSCGNNILCRYLDDVNNNIRVVRWLGFPDMQSIRDTYEEHYELCQILLEKNKRAARSAMKKHIQKSQALSKKVTLQQLAEKHREHLQEIGSK